MRTVEAHSSFLMSLVGPLEPETVALAETRDCALASPCKAAFTIPSFDNSAMDGYAVRSRDCAAPPVVLPVATDIPAGRGDHLTLLPATAHRIT